MSGGRFTKNMIAWAFSFLRTDGIQRVKSFPDRFIIELLDIAFSNGGQVPLIQKLQVHLFPNGDIHMLFCSMYSTFAQNEFISVGIENRDGTVAAVVMNHRNADTFRSLAGFGFLFRSTDFSFRILNANDLIPLVS